jgi:hypothetical protein
MLQSAGGDNVTMATPRRLRGIAGVAAAMTVIGGLLVFAIAATWPVHVTHEVRVPALHEVGTFDRHLVPTGQSVTMSRTDTCIPLRRHLTIGAAHDPAVCRSRDDSRLATAGGGLLVSAAGMIAVLVLLVWGGLNDRLNRRRDAVRMRSNPAPR